MREVLGTHAKLNDDIPFSSWTDQLPGTELSLYPSTNFQTSALRSTPVLSGTTMLRTIIALSTEVLTYATTELPAVSSLYPSKDFQTSLLSITTPLSSTTLERTFIALNSGVLTYTKMTTVKAGSSRTHSIYSSKIGKPTPSISAILVSINTVKCQDEELQSSEDVQINDMYAASIIGVLAVIILVLTSCLIYQRKWSVY